MKGRKRCRLHGCAPGSGAPKGNQNAFKHGRYSHENIQLEQALRVVLCGAMTAM
ncbi:hypothetical protein [Novosphingobium sp.]|uniref:hypothetical protein n=1 Tax=Novosphingobium sp. TaxID=1874826 RepID=UPI003C7CD932